MTRWVGSDRVVGAPEEVFTEHAHIIISRMKGRLADGVRLCSGISPVHGAFTPLVQTFEVDKVIPTQLHKCEFSKKNLFVLHIFLKKYFLKKFLQGTLSILILV